VGFGLLRVVAATSVELDEEIRFGKTGLGVRKLVDKPISLRIILVSDCLKTCVQVTHCLGLCGQEGKAWREEGVSGNTVCATLGLGVKSGRNNGTWRS
jgi:hypothetical protein